MATTLIRLDFKSAQSNPPGVLPYISYVAPKGMVFELYWSTGIDFDHYGLKSGMVFKGTSKAYKSICLFNSK